MAKKNQNYIAFIDLLETSERATNNPNVFYDSLSNFQDTLVDRANEIQNSGKVFFFSDCAYIESSNPYDMVKYLQAVRGSLLRQGYYLKGAVSKGSLKPKSKISSDQKDVVFGHSFGNDVVRVYSLHNTLRGIGIKIDKECKPAFEEFVVTSCHFPQNNQTAEPFFDLKFQEEEVEDDHIIKQLLRNFFISHNRIKRLGRYYVPFIISWIKSIDFTNVASLDEKTSAPDYQVQPYIYQRLLKGDFEKQFTDVAGMEYIYFSLLDKVYSESQSGKTQTYVANFLAKRKRFLKNISTLPEGIFDRKNKQNFLDFLSHKVAGDNDTAVIS